MVALPREAPLGASQSDTDTLAREYIQSFQQGKAEQALKTRPLSFGAWESAIAAIENVHFCSSGDVKAINTAIETLCKANNDLNYLLQPIVEVVQEDEAACPPLPESVKHDPALAAQACKWLDEYVAFSKYWSPRGYESYHEASGLALLSTVAGRRVSFPFGPRPQYTSLYIALLGESTFRRKSTTSGIYQDLLHAAGLDWLFGANITTPQKLLSDMTGRSIPANYEKLDPEEQERTRLRLAMPGQRGWYYDEFGLHLDQMVKETGVMADFKGLLRLLDDCKPTYETATQSRGVERIEKPYLSLLASMTPSDIKPHAQRDNKFWRDGLFARFCFVVPPRDAPYSRARFKSFGQKPEYPASLIQPIRRWHEALGMPEIEIVPSMSKDGTNITGYTIERMGELPEQICTAGPEIENALYAYENALIDMCEQKLIHESLHSNYGRLHILALRVAMLLASFDNQGRIEMRHWARAQQFAEDRRRDLHELYAQVNGAEESDSARMEKAICAFLEQQKVPCTASAIKQRCSLADVRKLSSKQITEICDSMAKAGTLKREAPGQGQSAPRFSLQN